MPPGHGRRPLATRRFATMPLDAFLELKQGGRSICQGETLDTQFRAKGAIQLTGFTLQSNIDLSSEAKASQNGDGDAKVFTLKIKKEVDNASPDLFRAYCLHATKQEKAFDEATLTVRKSAGQQMLQYLVLQFSNVTLQSYKLESSDGDSVPEENIDLAFGKLMIQYYPQKSTGGAAALKPGGWDFGSNSNL
jgi:type VI secretion system secreted protein Hcp